MAENIKVRWLVDHEQNKVAPKTLSTQILNEDGTRFKDTVENEITNIATEIATHASNNDIHVTAEEKEAWSNIEIPSLDGYATEDYVEALFKNLGTTASLAFYCIEDVTIVTNGVSKIYLTRAAPGAPDVEQHELALVGFDEFLQQRLAL